MSAEARLAELKIQLPPVPKPNGLYKPVVVVGNLAFVSGHAPLYADGKRVVGRIGDGMDLDAGKMAARMSGHAILATLRNEFGTLDKIKRVVKVLGMVNCTAEFQQHPAVINGCSELFVEIFGEENGVGARSAAGMNSLPGGIAVEIEAVFEIVRDA